MVTGLGAPAFQYQHLQTKTLSESKHIKSQLGSYVSYFDLHKNEPKIIQQYITNWLKVITSKTFLKFGSKL